jgi:hypothetical protein
MDEPGLTRAQLLLVVAKSALVRHLATGADKGRIRAQGRDAARPRPRAPVSQCATPTTRTSARPCPRSTTSLRCSRARHQRLLPGPRGGALDDRSRHLRGEGDDVQYPGRHGRPAWPWPRQFVRHQHVGAQRRVPQRAGQAHVHRPHGRWCQTTCRLPSRSWHGSCSYVYRPPATSGPKRLYVRTSARPIAVARRCDLGSRSGRRPRSRRSGTPMNRRSLCPRRLGSSRFMQRVPRVAELTVTYTGRGRSTASDERCFGHG